MRNRILLIITALLILNNVDAKDYFVASRLTNTLTFKKTTIAPDNESSWDASNTGNTDPGWNRYLPYLTLVIFDESFAEARPKSCYNWFGNYSSAIKEIRGIENLNTSEVTTMDRMFGWCKKLTSLDVSHFDTGNVTNMQYMFSGCKLLTTLDASNFNTAKVVDMSYMFNNCDSLKTLDISAFNTSNVTNMRAMFDFCQSLSELDVSHFDTGNVTDMSSMFFACYKLESLNVSNFNTSNVTTMQGMFSSCKSLTTLDISNFDTSNVTTMQWMFNGCQSLMSLDISNFDTSKVTNMINMFTECRSLTSLDVSNFNTSNVTNIAGMFMDCRGLSSIDISNFDTRNVTSIGSLFAGCTSLTSIDIRDNDLSNVTDMRGLFSFCTGLTSIDLSYFNTSKISDMSMMFAGCTGLTSIDISNFDTQNVTDMSGMFGGCTNLIKLNVSNFDTRRVTNMLGMFERCSSLTSLDLRNFNTVNVEQFGPMFWQCTSLSSVDLSSFNTSNVWRMEQMFEKCSNLRTIIVGKDWDISKVTTSTYMFSDCTSLRGGAGTIYDNACTGKDYARIDGGSLAPGYLTLADDNLTNNINISSSIEYTQSDIDSNPLFTQKPSLGLFFHSSNATVRGHLSVTGGTAISLGNYTQMGNLGYVYDEDKFSNDDINYFHPTTLMNLGSMRADNVAIRESIYRDHWHFLSFPFNVRVCDIEFPDDTYLAIRQYNSKARAAGQTNNTWDDLGYDDTMETGKGYILQFTKEDAGKTAWFSFKAINDTKKNNIFTPNDVTMSLEEYPAEFAHNRSWNLIGNPYPSFYDTRFMDIDGTITVWNGNGYAAYSLLDDAYVLMPFEAFFLQRPINKSNVTFDKDGRQHSHEASAQGRAPYMRRTQANMNRHILNFILTDGKATDRSRIVINEQASLDYETDKDASKFMEACPQTAQLFSVEGEVKYAINERPLGDGVVTMSVYAPQAGEYVLSLQSDDVFIKGISVLDTETNNVWSPNDGDYSFTASEGMHDGRFVISFNDNATSISRNNIGNDGLQVTRGLLSYRYASVKSVKIFDLSGRLLYDNRAKYGNVYLASGVYAVVIDGAAKKIIVK